MPAMPPAKRGRNRPVRERNEALKDQGQSPISYRAISAPLAIQDIDTAPLHLSISMIILAIQIGLGPLK